eukprot:CAMPEP_0114262944 /NCGR_PEP_ID=MMETSP0058-20121206/22159_1 /TAXON_ID=36894 /ORGANISM="Pyramimonas parkeae, CCMP726" /LENGTH=75 /DNA_ID=CAMNT_0001379017 /DNA_START=88 /DNA_END=315 /DNA_ORIENTATION=-
MPATLIRAICFSGCDSGRGSAVRFSRDFLQNGADKTVNRLHFLGVDAGARKNGAKVSYHTPSPVVAFPTVVLYRR